MLQREPARSVHSASGSLPSYPAWFLKPPQSRVPIATGYAASSFFEDQAFERARLHGAEKLRAKSGLLLEYTTFWEVMADDALEQRGVELFSDTLSVRPDSVYIIDAQTIGRMAVVLTATQPELRVSTNRVQPGMRPAWINRMPAVDGYFYGSGSSRVYYNEHDSWQEAEQAALKELISSVSLRIQRLDRSYEDLRNAVVLQTSKVRVEEYQVAERWRDENYCYVLIRARAFSEN